MHDDHSQDPSLPEQKTPVSAGRRLRYWLLGVFAALLLVLLAGLMLVGHYLSSPAVIKKIQQEVAEQAGIEIEFQTIGLDYFPQPTVSLQQVRLSMPNYGAGQISEIGLTPALLPLLVGDLRLGRLSLEQPQFSLDLPEPESRKDPASSASNSGLQARLAKGFAMLGQVSPDFELMVNGGRLQASRDQESIEAGALNLRLSLSVTDSDQASATLQSNAADLQVRRNLVFLSRLQLASGLHPRSICTGQPPQILPP